MSSERDEGVLSAGPGEEISSELDPKHEMGVGCSREKGCLRKGGAYRGLDTAARLCSGCWGVKMALEEEVGKDHRALLKPLSPA